MKKLIPYLLSLTLLVTGVSAAFAVEKKQKSTPPPKPTQQAAKDSSAKPAEKKTEKKSEVKSTQKPADNKKATDKKYDNFVDKNNNGVDDRRENLKKKDSK